MPLVKAGVVTADAAIAAGAFVGAVIIREGAPVLRSGSGWSDEFAPYAGIFYFVVVCRVVMLALEGSYRFHGAFSYTQEAITVFRATILSSLLSVAFAFLFRGGYAFRDFSYSRGVFVLDFFVGPFDDHPWSLIYAEFQLLALRDPSFAPTYLEHRAEYEGALVPVLDRTLQQAGRTWATDPAIAVRLLTAVYDDAVRAAILHDTKTYDLAVVRDTIVRVVLALTRRSKAS